MPVQRFCYCTLNSVLNSLCLNKIHFYTEKVSEIQMCGIKFKDWKNKKELENGNRLMEAETSSCSLDYISKWETAGFTYFSFNLHSLIYFHLGTEENEFC